MSSCAKCRVSVGGFALFPRPIFRHSFEYGAEYCRDKLALDKACAAKQLLLLLESASCACEHLIRPNTGSVAQQQRLHTQTGNGLGLIKLLLFCTSINTCEGFCLVVFCFSFGWTRKRQKPCSIAENEIFFKTDVKTWLDTKAVP